MTLGINSTFSKCNFESSFVSPGIIPWIIDDPVISPISDDFNGMSSESTSRNVFVNTRFVIKEIFINSESSSYGTISNQILLNILNRWKSIRWRCFVFIIAIISRVSRAIFVTSWRNLFDIRTTRQRWSYMMRTFFHCVWVTSFFITEVSSRNNSSSIKPVPRSSYLSSITSHT